MSPARARHSSTTAASMGSGCTRGSDDGDSKTHTWVPSEPSAVSCRARCAVQTFASMPDADVEPPCGPPLRALRAHQPREVRWHAAGGLRIEFNPYLRRLTGRITYGWELIEISLYHFREYGYTDAVQTLEHEMLHLYLHMLGKPSGPQHALQEAARSARHPRVSREPLSEESGAATSLRLRVPRVRAHGVSQAAASSATRSRAASAAACRPAARGTRASRSSSSRK